jgi:hypothetical protein
MVIVTNIPGKFQITSCLRCELNLFYSAVAIVMQHIRELIVRKEIVHLARHGQTRQSEQI